MRREIRLERKRIKILEAIKNDPDIDNCELSKLLKCTYRNVNKLKKRFGIKHCTKKNFWKRAFIENNPTIIKICDLFNNEMPMNCISDYKAADILKICSRRYIAIVRKKIRIPIYRIRKEIYFKKGMVRWDAHGNHKLLVRKYVSAVQEQEG